MNNEKVFVVDCAAVDLLILILNGLHLSAEYFVFTVMFVCEMSVIE